MIALAGSGLVYWQASQNGYNLVLAPEGVPQISVNWYALLAPVLGWIGAGLLAYRLADLAPRPRPRAARRRCCARSAGELAPTVAATMGRQRRLLAGAVTLVALTAAFAGSTAVFNATYQQQAEADARLTNGADVTVTESPGAVVGPRRRARARAACRGVASVEPLQHRFAYVGADLQDLYGVRPAIDRSPPGKLQDGWFAGRHAPSSSWTRSRGGPTACSSPQETVKDFQLAPGRPAPAAPAGRRDQAAARRSRSTTSASPRSSRPRRRTRSSSPTQRYVARATGSDAVGHVPRADRRHRARRRSPGAVRAQRRHERRGHRHRHPAQGRRLQPHRGRARRADQGRARLRARSSRSPRPASRSALGFSERRRTFAIAARSAPEPRQLGAFVWGESAFVTLGGLVLGAVIAAAITDMLVKVLTGVFDPPPDYLSIPWTYLAGVLVLTLGAVGVAGARRCGRCAARRSRSCATCEPPRSPVLRCPCRVGRTEVGARGAARGAKVVLGVPRSIHLLSGGRS